MNLPRVQAIDCRDASNACASAGVRNDSSKMGFIYRKFLPSRILDMIYRYINVWPSLRFAPSTRR